VILALPALPFRCQMARTVEPAVIALAVNARAFYSMGVHALIFPVLMASVLLALEATPDAS
jgi:hypothetical protein